jgi:hypothetical protein
MPQNQSFWWGQFPLDWAEDTRLEVIHWRLLLIMTAAIPGGSDVWRD